MNRQSSKTKLFLIELIIIILFFSIAGAVCMNIFASARSMSIRSTDLTKATMLGQTAVETFRDTGGAEDMAEELGLTKEGEAFAAYYDENWMPVSSDDYVYSINVSVEADEVSAGLKICRIKIDKNGKELYDVTSKKYQGGASGA